MATHFQRVLVPVDFTPRSETALDVASELARRFGGEMALLHVIETIDAEDDEIRRFYQTLESRAQEAIARLAERFAVAGVEPIGQIVYGKRGVRIVEFVREWGADLVVLGAHRLEPGASGGGWSTLSYQVSLLCPCPVLMVK